MRVISKINPCAVTCGKFTISIYCTKPFKLLAQTDVFSSKNELFQKIGFIYVFTHKKMLVYFKGKEAVSRLS